MKVFSHEVLAGKIFKILKEISKLSFITLFTAVSACGVNLKVNKLSPETTFPIDATFLVLVDIGGSAVTTTGVSLDTLNVNANIQNNRMHGHAFSSTMTSSHAMTGNPQVLLAAKDLEAEMRTLNLKTTNDLERATFIAYFSIATVRYDPLAGWIADRSILEIRDKESGETFFMFRNQGQAVTATVRTHINSLVRGMKKEIDARDK